MAYTDKLAKSLTSTKLYPGKPLEEKVVPVTARKLTQEASAMREAMQMKPKVAFEEKRVSESVTSLTELSKGLLRNYISKSVSDLRSSSNLRGRAMENGSKSDDAFYYGKIVNKRQAGVEKAVDKIAGTGLAKVHAKENAPPLSTNKLAMAMINRKLVVEAWVNGREKAKEGYSIWDKDEATKFKGQYVDFYEPTQGDKLYGKITHVGPDTHTFDVKGTKYTLKHRNWDDGRRIK